MNLGVRGILYGGSWSQDTEEDALLGLTMLTAIWNNDVQATAEAEPYGIPVNINSDPRHSASSGAEYEIDNQPDGELSYWPSNIGLAATFNPKYVLEFGKYSSIELRAMGITTALNPQSDLSTEPRWARVSGSYGEGSKLASDLVTAFTNDYQSTYGEDGEDLGWGEDSVAVITKPSPVTALPRTAAKAMARRASSASIQATILNTILPFSWTR